MHRSLRHLARTPHLRVLAWLAWLMLAVTPVYGTPDGMAGDSHASAPAASAMAMADHAAHDMSAMLADCCATQALHDHGSMNNCHCAATCVSVLPTLAMMELAPAPIDALSVPRHGQTAPDVLRSPPLRPPLLQTPRLT